MLESVRGPGFVTSFLYFFKPPFPSDGGYAAASAGRVGAEQPVRCDPFMSTRSNGQLDSPCVARCHVNQVN